jgi:hypothetical protein
VAGRSFRVRQAVARGHREAGTVRAALFILTLIVTASVANAQGTSVDQQAIEEWPPVPPINEQSVIGGYCIHRNLIYSLGDALCIGKLGLVCVPPPGPSTGGRPYWSSVPVTRGDVNWAPPANCGK